MAKKRGRSSKQVRETSEFANLRLTLPLLTKIDPAALLREIEDRRTYHPERAQRPALSLSGARHRLKAPPTRSPTLPFGVQFASPGKTLICIRRATRREVLFAFRKTGKGKSHKRPTRRWFSDVQC